MSLRHVIERIANSSVIRSSLLRIGSLKDDRRFRYSAFAVAIIIFGVGLYFSIKGSDLRWSAVDGKPIMWLVFAGIPATILLNSLEMQLSARMAGCCFSARKSIILTIYASAANMLPLPGAAMVRIAGLKSEGVSLGKSGAITLAIGLMWIGTAFSYAGLFILRTSFLLGLAFSTFGFVTLVISVFWTKKIHGKWAYGIWIALLKATMVFVGVWRIQISLLSLGYDVGITQVSIFAISNVLGSAVSIVPAGLGVREFVSAMLAPLVHITMSSAFLSAALDRIVAMSVLIILTLCLWVFSSRVAEAGRAKSD